MEKKKQEDLSPEELWKKVSQQLSTKKYETASKHAYSTMFDLSSVQNEIARIQTEKRALFGQLKRSEKEENLNGNLAGYLAGTLNDFKNEDIGYGSASSSINNSTTPSGSSTAINKADNEEAIAIEIENSILNTPFFKEMEPQYPVHKKRKVPSFFPKCTYLQFNNPGFYRKFDIDTLFFCFYYFKGLPQQTYAAIRLKQCAWRYHLKYSMWFQRLEEPKLITSEYEKGEFLFFDYETTWNFMKKNDFVFEYFYLESNDYY